MRIGKIFCLAWAFVLAGTTLAGAMLRFPYEDVTVVERSELIVVGRLKADSIQYIEHPKRSPQEGRSWEHHAMLVISEVLKGKCAEKEIPIVIHYGLDPWVGGRPVAGRTSDGDMRSKNTPKDLIQKLEKGWWNKGGNSVLAQERYVRYDELYNAVSFLRFRRDPRARAVLELTKKRWEAFNFENPQIVEECNAALKALAGK